MEQVDFSYDSAGQTAAGNMGPSPLAPRISVFAQSALRREEIAQDLIDAGYRVIGKGSFDELLEVCAPRARSADNDGEDGSDGVGRAGAGSEAPSVLGDMVMLDCATVDAARLAAFARLDLRIARSGAALIVSTSMQALDAVFAVFDQSAPQILVDPGRAERVIALGRLMPPSGAGRLREMSKAERLALLRLSEQVEAIARKLDGLSSGFSAPARDQATSEAGLAALASNEERSDGLHLDATAAPKRRGVRPPLPDPRLVRRILRARQARARFFDADLFADPAWDMLLDLTAAHAEHRRVSVTSLCIASGVPPTTALRWVRQMVEIGLFERVEDSSDKRRAFISLSDRAVDAMARYFGEFGDSLALAA